MFKIPPNIEYIIDRLIENGHKAYIVGGCVRDILLGKTPSDYDITTCATPNETTALFEKTIPTGIKHGTVTVVLDGEPIEVTTFRTENGYADNRRPDNVNFVSDIKEDLSRRDFTVNALAYNHKDGLVDCFNGKSDLKNRILRTVGDSDARFKEDALRILRLFRFASTLGFSIEENTLNSALKNAHLLQNVSRERIFIELKKAVLGDNFKAFSPLISCGGLEFLKVSKLPDFKKLKKHKNNYLISLYMLLNSDSLLELKPSNAEKQFFQIFDKLSLLQRPTTKTDLKEMLNLCNPDTLKAFFVFREWDYSLIDEIISNNEPYKISHLEIDGKTLLDMGYKGEKVGEILEHLRKIVIISPQKNNKKDLLKEIP